MCKVLQLLSSVLLLALNPAMGSLVLHLQLLPLVRVSPACIWQHKDVVLMMGKWQQGEKGTCGVNLIFETEK